MARLNVTDRVQGGFWRALEAVGVKDARSRWEAQSPFLQRAVPPLVIAALVLAIAWAAGMPPHPTLLALLAVLYALYLLPRRARRIALPLTVLGIALAYPILWANELNGTNVLFEIPVFKAFPNMDTMVAIVDLRDDGDRAEHGRRLRGPARSRLRRLLRDRRLHGGLVRLAALQLGRLRVRRDRRARPGSAGSTSRSGSSSSSPRSSPPSPGCSSACRRFACGATTSPSSRSASARSSTRPR